jgi:S1-C subfamily serine protease
MGVFVQQVTDQSGLSDASSLKGVRITSVGSQQVNSVEDVAAAIEEAKANQLGAVLLYIETPMGGKTHRSIRLK